MTKKIFRKYLDIKSLSNLKEVVKPTKNCSVNLLDPKDFQLNKFFYKNIGKKHNWVDRLIWTDLNWTDYVSNKKIITFIVPIIKNTEKEIENFKKVGTSILSMNNPKYSFNYFNRTMRLDETIEKKYVNFSPNKMLMFIKTHNSLHSVGPVEPLNDSIKFRNSVTFAFRKNFD